MGSGVGSVDGRRLRRPLGHDLGHLRLRRRLDTLRLGRHRANGDLAHRRRGWGLRLAGDFANGRIAHLALLHGLGLALGLDGANGLRLGLVAPLVAEREFGRVRDVDDVDRDVLDGRRVERVGRRPDEEGIAEDAGMGREGRDERSLHRRRRLLPGPRRALRRRRGGIGLRCEARIDPGLPGASESHASAPPRREPAPARSRGRSAYSRPY